MPNRSGRLDDVFQALADPSRREVVRRLVGGAASVGELARPFDMALPSFMQHMKVLERSGLVRSHKTGRVRIYRLMPRPLAAAEGWLAMRRKAWGLRLDQLDAYLGDLSRRRE